MSIEQSVLDKIQRDRGIAYEGATVTPCDPSGQEDGPDSLWMITHPAQHPLYAVVSHPKIFIMSSIISARALLHNLREAESEQQHPNKEQASFSVPLLKKSTGHLGHSGTRVGRH